MSEGELRVHEDGGTDNGRNKTRACARADAERLWYYAALSYGAISRAGLTPGYYTARRVVAGIERSLYRRLRPRSRECGIYEI